jgi:hypothetical protein
VHAACHGIAGVVGARVTVVAVGRSAADAGSTRARVVRRARVAVIARVHVESVYAARVRIARNVVGADVVVVAVAGGTATALDVISVQLTLLVHAAVVAAKARGAVRDVIADARRGLEVIGAGIAVVADRGRHAGVVEVRQVEVRASQVEL